MQRKIMLFSDQTLSACCRQIGCLSSICSSFASFFKRWIMTSLTERLDELEALKNSGKITENEYRCLRNDVLSSSMKDQRHAATTPSSASFCPRGHFLGLTHRSVKPKGARNELDVIDFCGHCFFYLKTIKSTITVGCVTSTSAGAASRVNCSLLYNHHLIGGIMGFRGVGVTFAAVWTLSCVGLASDALDVLRGIEGRQGCR